MSQLNDLKFEALGNQGYIGTIVDRWSQWLVANGATSKIAIPDQEQEFLQSQGYWLDDYQHLNDAWYAFLGSLGYLQGTLDERWYAFWFDGGVIGPPEAPIWTTDPPAVPDGTKDVFYRYSLAADLNTTQGVVVTVASGALPDGLSINGVVIEGVPTTEETQSGITLRAENTEGFAVSLPFAISITLVAPIWTTDPPILPVGEIGVAYSYDFAADLNTTDGVTVTQTGAGSLPPGLSLAGTVLSGTPTGTSNFYGNLQFTATNSGGSAESAVTSITINPAVPNWDAQPLPPLGEVNTPYEYDLTPLLNTTDGVVVTVTNGALPPGLNIVGLSIQGTPTTEGTYPNIQLTASNASGSDETLPFSMVIAAAITVDIRLDDPVQNAREVFDRGYETFSGLAAPGIVGTIEHNQLVSIIPISTEQFGTKPNPSGRPGWPKPLAIWR